MARFQVRKDTSARWVSINPTLASGEPGYAVDANEFKVGDGLTAWNDLDALGAGGGVEGIYQTTVGTTLGEFATIDEALDNGHRSILIIEAGTYSCTKHRLFDIDLAVNQQNFNIHVDPSIDRSSVLFDINGYEWLWTTAFAYTGGTSFTATVDTFANTVSATSISTATLGMSAGDIIYSSTARIHYVIEEIIDANTFTTTEPIYPAQGTAAATIYFIKGANPISFANLVMYNRTAGVVSGSYDGGWPAFFNATGATHPRYDVSIPVIFDNVRTDFSNVGGSCGLSYDSPIVKATLNNSVMAYVDNGDFYVGRITFNNSVVDKRAFFGQQIYYNNSNLINYTQFTTNTYYDNCTFNTDISAWAMPSLSVALVNNCTGINSNNITYIPRSSTYI